MDLSAGSKTFRIFTNGPIYRDRLEQEENVIDFSSFRQLHSRFASRSFSIKYVTSGIEMYTVKGTNYQVSKEKYLLTNAFTNGDVLIDSAQDVKGICIELSPQLLAEVLSINHDPTSPYPQKDFYNFLTTANFFEHDYHASKTGLGKYLQCTIPNLSTNALTDEFYLKGFFYGLAENIIADQQEMHKYFTSFRSVKDSTNRDLLNRLLKGKELMDDCYTEKISIDEIAQAAAMSEYYFLRLFKQTFTYSPHRYLVNKRLQKAKALLYESDEPIIDIAYKCGFADVYALSKAFKKQFGQPPTTVRKQK